MEIFDPFTHQPVRWAKPVVENDGSVLSITLGYPLNGFEKHWEAAMGRAVRVESKIRAHQVQPRLAPHATIKNIIAVASGKGGVGKSTTAVHLAIALKQLGAQVGLLDADIYGPSQPTLLGVRTKPEIHPDKKWIPPIAYGMPIMSMGFLVDEKAPMVWRGPMVSGALLQLLNDTYWGPLDYLILDLPPGTGDIQLTLGQKVPVAGVVVVTTPQALAVVDAVKAIEMFKKVSVPVLGIVENMTSTTCPHCNHALEIFGEGGGASLAQSYGLPLLGQIPLDARLRQDSDGGRPILTTDPTSAMSQKYLEAALAMAAHLANQERYLRLA